MASSTRPVTSVASEMASSACSLAAPSVPPLLRIATAEVVASTLMTATAGVSGPAPAGGSVVVRAMTRPVIADPISSADSPGAKPPCRFPWNTSALNETQ